MTDSQAPKTYTAAHNRVLTEDGGRIVTSAIAALTRAEAIHQGNVCMAEAHAAHAEAMGLKKVVSRLNVTGNRLELATFWTTRATAFYALAAVLPAD
jgi:hypothetical protein